MSPWGSSTQGNGITVWRQEHFSDYPNGYIGGNQTTSIGYFQITAGNGPDVTVPNITTQANSIVISVMPVDQGAGTEFGRATQYFRHSTADNTPGVQFIIRTDPAVGGAGAFATSGIFRYWLIHPAW